MIHAIQAPNFVSFLPESGTAIGDALWLAQVSTKPGPATKKIVIIGDGDNTAGVLSPWYAAGMAKERKIQVYTIGIGNTGPVPFGRDSTGFPYLIDNTFTDADFR